MNTRFEIRTIELGQISIFEKKEALQFWPKFAQKGIFGSKLWKMNTRFEIRTRRIDMSTCDFQVATRTLKSNFENQLDVPTREFKSQLVDLKLNS